LHKIVLKCYLTTTTEKGREKQVTSRQKAEMKSTHEIPVYIWTMCPVNCD